MTYEETLEYMFSQLPMYQRIGAAAYKANLDNTIALDNYLQHPHTKYKTIHIAGTNGKGTTSHSIASVLQEAGYKVGLYTSPHLLDFRERIRVNGEKISKEFVVDFVEKHMNFLKSKQLSFFEMTVGMAFDYFAKQNIDVAVIEVGMGGRLDSTNIIKPVLSIITNISYDHQKFLGNDLISIAKEKAGIIKKDIPVVVGETKPNVKAVFTQKADETDAPIFFANHNFTIQNFYENDKNQLVFNIAKHGINFCKNLTFDLGGFYQQQNIITILQALEILSNFFKISTENIFNGLAKVTSNTGLMGRWQTISQKPHIICDVGHNQDGISQIVNQIKQTKYNKLHFIYGVVNDKDITNILKLLPTDAKYYFTKASVERALDENTLYNEAISNGLNGKKFSTVKSAIESAINDYKENDLIFISGSTFVVADAFAFFNLS